MTENAKSLVAYCRENGLVCPMPPHWNALWKLLPERRELDRGWELALALILAAGHHSSNLEKMLRLDSHIEWADRYDTLELVVAFLRKLSEPDWHPVGD